MSAKKQKANQDAEQSSTPKWIDSNLIQRALKNGGENVQVKEITIRMAIAAGDNYASTIYRVMATLSDGTIRPFLVKGPPPGEAMEKLTKEAGIFRRESLMLAEVVPQIQALLEEAAPGKYPPLAARCPLHGAEPVEFLVLEDLAPGGFKMADRKRGLNLRHSLLALRTLARYHAASHVLLKRKPEIADKLPNDWLKAQDAMNTFLQTGIQSAATALRSWLGFEEYATILEKFKPGVLKCAVKIFSTEPGDFTVILHADFWVNNMMFRYADGIPTGHRLVDFQGSLVGSPTIDVLYFLGTSVTDEVSTHHEDILLREYHHELQKTLALLGMEAPSLTALLKDLNKHGAQALIATINVIPIVRSQRAVDIDAALSGDASAVSDLYEDPAVKKWMQRVIPEYKRRGWIPS